MASQIKVDEIAGAAGSIVTIPVGQTLDVLGTLDIDAGTLVLPANVVLTAATQTLTNKTLTLPILASVSNSGTITIPSGTDTLVARATTDTLTNKTLTSPAIGTSILDTNGNELVLLTATGSAVNEITIANAISTAKPVISATGTDTNIGISIQPKGTGTVTLDQLTFPTTTGNTDQILTSNGAGVLSFVDNSGGTSWQAVQTTGFTAVGGEGYFCNTTGGAFSVALPAGTLGDEVTLVDYAGTFDTNNLTVAPNGSEKIQGVAASLTVSIERAGLTLAYVDATQGWLLKDK
jgi:hypothetical protein|tara:strand:+ start:866 stop:1741 length:876 start_codon:yes stop_codon:yes gene_type:complete